MRQLPLWQLERHPAGKLQESMENRQFKDIPPKLLIMRLSNLSWAQEACSSCLSKAPSKEVHTLAVGSKTGSVPQS